MHFKMPQLTWYLRPHKWARIRGKKKFCSTSSSDVEACAGIMIISCHEESSIIGALHAQSGSAVVPKGNKKVQK